MQTLLQRNCGFMNEKSKVIIIVLVILLVLLVPVRVVYKDGGTKEYKSLTYKYIEWHRLMSEGEGIYEGTSFYFFPKNFLSIDTLYRMETGK